MAFQGATNVNVEPSVRSRRRCGGGVAPFRARAGPCRAASARSHEAATAPSRDGAVLYRASGVYMCMANRQILGACSSRCAGWGDSSSRRFTRKDGAMPLSAMRAKQDDGAPDQPGTNAKKDEIMDLLKQSLSESEIFTEHLRKADRAEIEMLQKEGELKLRQIVEEAKQEFMENMRKEDAMGLGGEQGYAAYEEFQAKLAELEKERDRLLSAIKSEREIIRQEYEEMQGLADMYSAGGNSKRAPREIALTGVAWLLCSAALFYVVQGVTEGRFEETLPSATIDAALAAVAVFVLRRSERKP
ncbi:hypothetical protein FVE85_3359 [Porphyridium purpureum]|uniref:Uncharacterized protein n=1 Tax=Porphyridium purpureum TaxID=35688 RepID=A0A5J4YV98_PORPP|nr:hypothetical protein FVE85_3359 [Porphyridium purpureum]|eukprot:POR3152..scf227_4